MTSPVGTTKYHYDDSTGRLDEIETPQGKKFRYSYDHGQLAALEYPNGIVANYDFDDNGNLTDLHYQKGDGSTLQRFQYDYDKNRMRTAMTDNDGLHNYFYDSIYQVIGATHPTPPRPLEQFQYDAVGNLLGGGRVHNGLNQLVEDDSCWYLYDLDGNMTSKVSKTTGDSTKFTWDIENRLIRAEKPGTVAECMYDALGRRMRKTVNGGVHEYRYDRENLIFEMNDAGETVGSYAFGPGIDNPIMITSGAKSYCYVRDGLGSVTALTDTIGDLVKEYAYSSFGAVVKEAGIGILNPFAYTSREWDEDVGLYYYRARYYDAQIGRFLNQDPIGFKAGDINVYRYVWNSPLNAVDPSGLSAYDPGCMAACVGDAVLNFGVGFIPGANAIEFVLELSGVDVNLFQGLLGYDTPLDVSSTGAAAAVGSALKLYANTSYEAAGGEGGYNRQNDLVNRDGFNGKPTKQQEKMLSRLGNLSNLRKLVSVFGTISNLLNFFDFLADLSSCEGKCEIEECPKKK